MRTQILLGIGGLLLTGVLLSAASDPLDSWTRRYPDPSIITITDNPAFPGPGITPITGCFLDVVFGGGFFIATGTGDEVLKSGDGFNWVKRPLPEGTVSVGRVFYLQGAYFALSERKILRSVNGDVWQQVFENPAAAPTCMAEGTGRLVVTTGSDQLLVSTNGIDWTATTSGFDGNQLMAICYAKGMFVTVGGGPSGVPRILTSTNGLTWTTNCTLNVPNRYTTRLTINDIVYTGSRFVGVGTLASQVARGYAELRKVWFSSTDGLTWNAALLPLLRSYGYGDNTEPGEFLNAMVVNGRVFANGKYDGYYTLDADDNWALHDSLPWFFEPRFAYGRGLCVAVGKDRLGDSAGRPRIMISEDASSWRASSNFYSLPAGLAPSLAAGGGLAIGLQTLTTAVRSSNGVVWMQDAKLPDLTDSFVQLIRFANDHFFVLSPIGSANAFSVAASTDGVAWQVLPVPRMYDVAYGAGTYVFVGRDANVCSSSDLALWFNHPTPAPGAMFGVVRGLDRFVAIGNAFSLVSMNGSDWGLAAISGQPALNAIAYGGGLYVAVGYSGTILSSTNGVAWSPQISPTSNLLGSIKYAGQRFIAAGDNGTVVSSIDGTNWVKHSFPEKTSLEVADLGNSVLLSTSYGGIFQSECLSDAVPQIVRGLSPASVSEGTTVILCVSATGSGPLTYHWTRDGQPVDGATSPVLELVSAKLSDAGDYQVTVQNPLSSASSSARLNVEPFIGLPARLSFTHGDSDLSLHIVATPGKKYRIEFKDDLGQPDWNQLSEQQILTPWETLPIVPSASAARVFRATAVP